MRWKIGLALGAIVFTALLIIGWQLAPRIEDLAPADGVLRGRQPLEITFSRSMDSASVENRISLDPDQPGEFSWNADQNQLRFTPGRNWPAGQKIIFQLAGGAHSRIQLPLLGGFKTELTVSPILLAYLWPADGISNLYLVNPISGESTALTQEEKGLQDYSITPSGEKIYYSTTIANGISRIMSLDGQTGQAGEVLACEDGLCTAPRASFDDHYLAYEFIPRGAGKQPTVQVLNIKTLDRTDLGEQGQYLEKPSWSPSGWLSYYNQTQKGYQFWNPATGEKEFLPNETGGDGSWSADGRYFISSEILFLSDTLAPRHLLLYDFKEKNSLDLSRGSYPEDLNPAFAPAGLTVAYSHKSLAPAQWTPGRELWILNISSGENTQLTDDVDYQHTSFAWHPDRQRLAYVRYNQAALSDPPEIWLIDTTGGEPLRLIINGFQPGWIP